MIDGDFAQLVHIAANAVMLEGMPVIPHEVRGDSVPLAQILRQRHAWRQRLMVPGGAMVLGHKAVASCKDIERLRI